MRAVGTASVGMVSIPSKEGWANGPETTMQQRLTWKLAVFVTVGIALVHAAFGYARIEREVALFEGDMRRDHDTMAHALGVAVLSTQERSGRAQALELVADADLATDRAEIRWEDGETGLALPTAQSGLRPHSVITEQGEERVLVSRLPLLLGAEPGALVIQESLTAEEAYVTETVAQSVLMLGVLIACCFVILSVAGWLLIQRPMGVLLAKLQRIGDGHLDQRTELVRRDELGALDSAVVAMCGDLRAVIDAHDQQLDAKLSALQQLRHAERLATVGKLASGVAHELGTPLNVISARAKMIVNGRSEGLEIQSDAAIIVHQTDRITAIIRQLLDFARQRPPRRRPEDLESVCAQAVRMLEPIARKRAVELRVEVMGEGSTAVVDSGQIQQVLTNLVVNGIHAQPEGGVVRVRIGATPPAALEGHARIEVEDEGEGMAPEIEERVFEPFFTTKDVGQGTGLGLSVAYGIVREHGGQITVASEPGRGTRFTIDLPVGDS